MGFVMRKPVLGISHNHVQTTAPGGIGQSLICLTADPGVASLIPVRSHNFVEIDHEIISTAILLPSADSRKGCCQFMKKFLQPFSLLLIQERFVVSYKRKYMHKVLLNA